MEGSRIEILKQTISFRKFPIDFRHFGGVNLIIADDLESNYLEGDLAIYTEHAAALSWLIVELKKIYDSKLNYPNNYYFYHYIGQLIEASVNSNDYLFHTMLFATYKIEDDWGEEDIK